MLKIAIKEAEAASVRIPSDLGGDVVVTTVISANQLITLLGKSRELRWLMAADGKWWVWDSYKMIHMHVAETLGYTLGDSMYGYIYHGEDESDPGAMIVSWYNEASLNKFYEPSARAFTHPNQNPTFARVMSDPAITIEPAMPIHGQIILKPSDVKRPAEVS